MAGTPGSAPSVGPNQDGATPAGNEISKGAHTPGEVLYVGQDASHSAAAGPNIDEAFVEAFVMPAFDLAVQEPLRNALIWDQFASRRFADGDSGSRQLFLGEDIDPAGATTPLVENLDVDSVTFGVWSLTAHGDEYGRAVSRTRLANARTRINIDPMIVDRVAFDASRAVDTLAKSGFTKAFDAGIGYNRGRNGGVVTAKPSGISVGAARVATPATHTVPTAVGTAASVYLSTTVLQIAGSMLAQQNAMPFSSGNFILLTGPVGAQHLKNERDTGGFRYVTARNEGMGGNSTVRGQIGMTEGVDIVVSNTVPDGKAYLIARNALAKVALGSEGYGDSPQAIVAPVIDKLRRFLSWGWLHFVGYSPYDVRAMIEIEYDNVWRPNGAAGLGASHAGMAPITSATAVAGAPGVALKAAFDKFIAPTP
jgi:hypothetical protein